jgi:hypothetical protein
MPRLYHRKFSPDGEEKTVSRRAEIEIVVVDSLNSLLALFAPSASQRRKRYRSRPEKRQRRGHRHNRNGSGVRLIPHMDFHCVCPCRQCNS